VLQRDTKYIKITTTTTTTIRVCKYGKEGEIRLVGKYNINGVEILAQDVKIHC